MTLQLAYSYCSNLTTKEKVLIDQRVANNCIQLKKSFSPNTAQEWDHLLESLLNIENDENINNANNIELVNLTVNLIIVLYLLYILSSL